MSHFFTEDELKRIEEAVREAESNVSGEIVPVFVGQSDPYEHGNLRAGVVFACLSAMVWVVLYEFAAGWSGHWFYTPEALMILMIAGFCLGFVLATFVPLFRMVFVLGNELGPSVERAAKLAFLKEEIFKTKNRTGILIFISKLEHRVQILGDTGISEKVSQAEWNHVLDTIIHGLRTNKKTEGICKGIKEAQELLLKYGFTADADDTNELPNNLRLR